MTAPREWPNNSRIARDEAANAAQRGIRRIEAALPTEDNIKTKLMLTELYVIFQNIQGWLQSAGAPTTPTPADELPITKDFFANDVSNL